MKYMRYLTFFIMMIFSGCTSFEIKIAEKIVGTAGQVLDGSAFAEKKIARYRAQKKEGDAANIEIIEAQNKQGQRALVIMPKEFPAIKIRASAPDAQGNFWLTSLEYVSGSVSGWNEYSLEIMGTGNFAADTGGAVFSLAPEIEAVQISRGKIKRYDTRVTGGEALTSLRNRELRIDVLVEWMKEREDAPREMTRNYFNVYWKPILFPEMCAKKKRPALWQNEGDIFVNAEDIRWNTSYTARVFPEELKAVRDSGTLLRDWEEAFEWLYLRYEWETLAASLSRQIILKRIK